MLPEEHASSTWIRDEVVVEEGDASFRNKVGGTVVPEDIRRRDSSRHHEEGVEGLAGACIQRGCRRVVEDGPSVSQPER